MASTQNHRVKIDGILYPYDDATQDVTIQRTLLDVFRGNPGVPGECMNAKCIIRNKNKFPHPVLAASVTKSRVFILDSPEHAVRYALGEKDGRLIAQHDEESLGQPGELVLRAPRGTDRKGSDKRRRPHSRRAPRSSGHRLARGEKARLLAAVGAAK